MRLGSFRLADFMSNGLAGQVFRDAQGNYVVLQIEKRGRTEYVQGMYLDTSTIKEKYSRLEDALKDKYIGEHSLQEQSRILFKPKKRWKLQ